MREVAESNGETVIDPSTFKPPYQYTVLKYRRMMRMSYEDVMNMPLAVFESDIEMMNLEQEYAPRRKT